MRSFAIVVLAALVALAPAHAEAKYAGQLGYGRFPCGKLSGSKYVADQNMCKYSILKAPGTNTNSSEGNQGDGPNPKDAKCVEDKYHPGYFYCGIAGAKCTSNANCDNGKCVKGVCTGDFSLKCNGDDAKCLGDLYCNAQDFSKTSSGTCGGRGAFCQDYTKGSKSYTDAENFKIFNAFCKSGYCNTQTGNCDTRKKLGQYCGSDVDFACETGLVCTKKVCVRKSKTSRLSRRSLHHFFSFPLHSRRSK